MKIYLLYIKPTYVMPECDSYYHIENGVKELYAITNNKKLFKSFKQTRDMEKFTVKIADMDSDEYKQLARNNRECVLEMCKFKSKKPNPYPKTLNESFGNCIEEYNFSVTYLESQSVIEECNTYFERVNISLPNPYIFKNKFKRILKRMSLDYMFKLTRFPFIGDDAMYCTNDEIARRSSNYKMRYIDTMFLRDDMDFTMPDVWVDQLQIFLKLYGNLLK